MTNQRTRQRRGQQASVDIVENPRVRRASVTEQEAFIVRNETAPMVQTVERDSEGVTVEHVRPGTVTMYKPTEHHGFVPKTVSASAMRLLIRQGWSEFCPLCGGHHLDSKGEHSTDPNLCKGRTPVAVRRCPVCRKRIYDNDSLPVESKEDEDAHDPNLIEDNSDQLTTPEERTRLLLDLHMWVRHPRAAQMRGLKPLPDALQDLLEQPKPA
mgnify:CR=1 FL=1